MRISDNHYCWLPVIKENSSFWCLATRGRKLCGPDHVLCMPLYFLAYMNTIPNNLDHIVSHSEFHRNFKECKYNEQLLSYEEQLRNQKCGLNNIILNSAP